MKTTEIGKFGEEIATKFLKKRKFRIIDRNIHLSHNEIDIIACLKKEKIIAFVEVKSRTVNEDLYSYFGSPASAVTKEKQARTAAAAKSYLRSTPRYKGFQPRFDVIEVYINKSDMTVLKINHIENAFGV